ncbi:hypothetical protein ACGFOU_34060 [Streptomyces sp. NPDC048595]|uniref:hypothetical protein n=1 Tax=Streptomyces sp. NPDC048595 TaxID=3365576 RepID=UPI003720763F
MRTVLILTSAVLAGAGLFGLAGTAVADSPAPSPSASESAEAAAPTEAGTSFRTATAIKPDQPATADASTGDYLYWVLPVDAQQRATVKAKVTLPAAAARHGAATWQLDVYDGLRRRQACVYGARTKAAGKDAGSVELSCTLRTVRGWAEPWANDPLPGSYYVRLTVVDLPQEDLGLPVHAEVEASVADQGGAHAVDGRLAAPLVPGAAAAASKDDEGASSPRPAALREPDGGWSSGRWSDRWIWTAAGGALAALAGIAGYRATRGRGRPSQLPPGA